MGDGLGEHRGLMTQGLGAGIVRLRSCLTNDVVGHGVLVDDEHVATCAHVVNAALGRDLDSPLSPVGEFVRLEFPVIAQLTDAPPERLAQVESWALPGTSFEGVDVAGLTLASEPRPTGAVPMPLANEARSEGQVLLYGPVPGRPGGWVPAQLRPLVTRDRQQIDQSAHGVFTARPGFSGTPVVDPATGNVVGLLVATAVRQGSSDIYAIPAPSIVSSWSEVFAPVPPSPYKGLHAFESSDRDLFFGRQGVVQELAHAVATHGLVPVVGASGVGKSSVVYAGLLPELEQQGGWDFVTVRPRPTLLMALSAGFARLSGSGIPVPVTEIEDWHDRLSRLGLVGAAQLACAASSNEHLLVTVDQFEEVLGQACDPLLQQFAELPAAGLLTAVVTLREDSFGTFFVRHAEFGERLRQNAVALRGMDRSELEEAVKGPAGLRSVHISDRLCNELVEAVYDHPGALPLLEFSLDQMWRTLRPGQETLSFDAYEEIGHLDGALAAHADRVLDGLDETERASVRKLFVNHLTSPTRPDVRQVIRRSECVPSDWQIIVRLANERLLTVGRDDDGNETAEVVHEALLRAWNQLRSWLDAERPFRSWRQLLRFEMTQWSEAAERGAFLTGALLVTSERWLAERSADLDIDERRFIEMSITRRNEEESRYQVLYRRSIVRALSQAAETADDPVLALLLATEVLQRSPDAQAARLVRICLRNRGISEIAPITGEAEDAEFDRARQRRTLLDWSCGRRASISWPPELPVGGSEVHLVVDGRGRVLYDEDLVIPMPGPVVAAAYIQSGFACLATEDGELAVWQLTDHWEKVCSRSLRVPVMSIAVDDTGQTLAVACDDGFIYMLRVEGLLDVERLSLEGFVVDLDVGGDQLVAALSYDRRIRVWNLVSQTLVCESSDTTDAIRLAIDSSGDYVIVGDSSPRGRIPLSAQALTAWAHQAAGRELTADERRRYIDDPPVRQLADPA